MNVTIKISMLKCQESHHSQLIVFVSYCNRIVTQETGFDKPELNHVINIKALGLTNEKPIYYESNI